MLEYLLINFIKRDSHTGVSLRNLRIFEEHLFWWASGNDRFYMKWVICLIISDNTHDKRFDFVDFTYHNYTEQLQKLNLSNFLNLDCIIYEFSEGEEEMEIHIWILKNSMGFDVAFHHPNTLPFHFRNTYRSWNFVLLRLVCHHFFKDYCIAWLLHCIDCLHLFPLSTCYFWDSLLLLNHRTVILKFCVQFYFHVESLTIRIDKFQLKWVIWELNCIFLLF